VSLNEDIKSKEERKMKQGHYEKRQPCVCQVPRPHKKLVFATNCSDLCDSHLPVVGWEPVSTLRSTRRAKKSRLVDAVGWGSLALAPTE
jgi:transposase